MVSKGAPLEPIVPPALPSTEELAAYDILLNRNGQPGYQPPRNAPLEVKGKMSPSDALVSVTLSANARSITHSGAQVTYTAGAWTTTFSRAELDSFELAANNPARVTAEATHGNFTNDGTGAALTGTATRRFTFL